MTPDVLKAAALMSGEGVSYWCKKCDQVRKFSHEHCCASIGIGDMSSDGNSVLIAIESDSIYTPKNMFWENWVEYKEHSGDA